MLGGGEAVRPQADGRPGDVSPAVRVARVITVACVLCAPLGESAVAAGAPSAPPVTVSIVHVADPVIRWPAHWPAAPGDHEPPHNEAPEHTRDGSVPTYAVTAPTAQALTVPPAAGLPGALACPSMRYCRGIPRNRVRFAAATHIATGTTPLPGPGAAPAGPRLAS